jgi:hypothetical protein
LKKIPTTAKHVRTVLPIQFHSFIENPRRFKFHYFIPLTRFRELFTPAKGNNVIGHLRSFGLIKPDPNPTQPNPI